MAAIELIPESPDGHAHPMGTCYSAGKKKTTSSSSSSSSLARSPKAEPRPACRSSSTGKAGRTPQNSCSKSSLQASDRSASTSKGSGRPSLASASAKGAHTPCKTSESSLSRCFSAEDRTRTHGKDSQQERELSTAEDCRTDTSSTADAIHAHHTSQKDNLVDSKKQTHHMVTSSDVGSVAGTSKASSRVKKDDGHDPREEDDGPAPAQLSPRISHHVGSSRAKEDDGGRGPKQGDGLALAQLSPARNSHRLASSKAKQDDGRPAVQCPRVPEMRSPSVLNKSISLSLKSGVGPYEVLTPRKSTEAGGLQGSSTPRKNSGGKQLTKSASFSPSGTKDQGAKAGLCKNCKTSNLDSVCFIANDGKIAAASTGPASICHFHHCSSPNCAANPNYHPPSPLPCKKGLSKIQPARTSEPARTKSSINVSQYARDDRIVCASDGGNEKDLPPRCTQPCREVGHIDAETLVSNQSGKEGSQGVHDAQKICTENEHDNAVALAQSFDDSNDGIEQSARIALTDLQRIASKALPHHADNELSCSDDGVDTPTTSKRSTKGAFDDLSNTELQQLSAAKASQPRKSSMERMRQKYLDTLKEHEAETVRLKKQEMDARKQAGEWMLDCAMGEILHKLAPDGEAGVKVLVEAFETIMQHSDGEAHHEEHVAQECIGGLEDTSKPLHP